MSDVVPPVTESAKRPGVVRRSAGAVGRFWRWSVIGDYAQFRDSAGALVRGLRSATARQQARQEAFAEAMARLGLTAADVQQRIEELRGRSLLYGGIAGVALVIFMAMPWVTNPMSHALLSLGVFLLALVRYSAVRFRMAQCQQRELMPYWTWVRRWWAGRDG